MQGTGSIPSRTERKIRTCLLCCLGWLPPRMGGAVYSFAFLMGGLLWVSGRALIDFYQFLRGQIPPRQLWWSVVGNSVLKYIRPVPTHSSCAALFALFSGTVVKSKEKGVAGMPFPGI